MKLQRHENRTERAHLICLLAMLSIYGAVCSHVAHAQSAPAKPAAADAAAKSADSAGFSIESEMLTYRALESNSEAVACDVAAYLNGGSANFTNPPAGTVCTVNAGANPKASVVIFPFDQSELDDFRNWRAAMETMKELRTRAATHCPENAPIQVTDRGAISQILGSTPAGTGLSIAQGLLGMPRFGSVGEILVDLASGERAAEPHGVVPQQKRGEDQQQSEERDQKVGFRAGTSGAVGHEKVIIALRADRCSARRRD